MYLGNTWYVTGGSGAFGRSLSRGQVGGCFSYAGDVVGDHSGSAES